MRTAKEIEEANEYYGGYQGLYNEFGTVVLEIDTGSYQGDTRVLFHNEDGKVGYLLFGWGSCSGCDAYEACNTTEDYQELMDRLYDSVHWFDTVEEALTYFENHDWEGDFDWYNEERKEFLDGAMEYLNKQIKNKETDDNL